MFIILVAHIPDNWLNGWIPARFGLSDATEIFVFCSGMASAIAFGKVFSERGLGLGTARVAHRVWQVYWAHVGLFVAIAAAMAALNASGLFQRDYVGELNLHPFFDRPQENLIGLLTLTYVPNYFDILPMYLVILAMLPAVVALSRVHVGLAAAVVVTVWLAAQERLLAMVGLTYGLSLPAEPWSGREWFFNPFGWQLIFFTGFALMRGWIPAPPVRAWLVALALVVVLANLAISDVAIREFGFRWAGAWRGNHQGWVDKTDFAFLRYLHFLSLAYLAWILAGPRGAHILPPEGDSQGARAWAMVLGWITKVGQQSLAIFITSMFLARLLGVALDVTGRSHLTMFVVNLTGFAILVVVAHAVGWFKSQPWRKAKG